MTNSNAPCPTGREIRNTFIEFFKEKSHQFVRSAPVIAHNDPTLLFTNAGMNQFKPIFLGENKDGLQRAVNSQKVIRVSGKHNDLEEVGKDTYHHTFFEMLGNWSFGDYYKKEAIHWAWTLLTDVWKLDKARLYATVYNDDDEAKALWQSETDIDPSHIMRFGDKENFWEMGEVGPCGPCSEIHYDTGDEKTRLEVFAHPENGVNGTDGRFIEIWNLVFIQFERMADGSLKPLANKHVDTGMGFERICAILQHKPSNYESDIFMPLIQEIADLSGVTYDSGDAGIPHRVIADHVRMLSFSITDGAMPGNEGRGYVLRRILRRAARYARNLGQTKPFITRLVPKLVALMSDAFPELAERQAFVTEVIKSEEERFMKTLDQGLDKFRKMVDQLRTNNKKIISGKDAFTLYDTYGFPPDLTRLMAEEEGLDIDQTGYDKYMKEQHDRAKKAAKFDGALASDESWNIVSPGTQSKFTGYSSLSEDARLLRFHEEKKHLLIVLDKTPFYAEAGGQVGDQGTLESDKGVLHVIDTFKLHEMIVHKVKRPKQPIDLSGTLSMKARVNPGLRDAILKNHSATHLLQAALQATLGDHVQQQGSRVSPDSLRFDFTHFKALSDDEIMAIEKMVNEKIQSCLTVSTSVQNLQEAKAAGAMALFGEKYEDDVRVIQMEAFSLELCGGTHVSSTGQIGLFKIISEESIAAGVRRIEALTGQNALKLIQQQTQQLADIRQSLNAKPGKESMKVSELADKLKETEKGMEGLRKILASQKAESILGQTKQIGEVQTIIARLGGLDKSDLNALIDNVLSRMQSTVAVLTNALPGSLSIIVLVSKDLTNKVKAGDLVKKLSAIADGKGGGRPDRAQAGSKKPEKEPDVIACAEDLLAELLG